MGSNGSVAAEQLIFDRVSTAGAGDDSMTHITSLQTSCLTKCIEKLLVLQCNNFNGLKYNIPFLNINIYKKETNSSQRN